MSTDTLEHSADSHDDHDEHVEHPSDAKYVIIAVILAVLTALEVATYFFEDAFNWGPLLILLMIVKGIIVAGFFMHLKFDNKILRNVFLAGLLLAVGVYAAFLTTFDFWDNSGLRENYPDNIRSTPYVAPDAEAEGEADGEHSEGEAEGEHSEGE